MATSSFNAVAGSNSETIAMFGSVLWTNPAPSNSFAEVILPVPNINKYKIVLIQFLFNKDLSEEYSGTFTAFIGQKGYLEHADQSGVYFRTFTTYTNAAQVYFTQGGKAGVGFDNQYMIPYKIIGII